MSLVKSYLNQPVSLCRHCIVFFCPKEFQKLSLHLCFRVKWRKASVKTVWAMFKSIAHSREKTIAYFPVSGDRPHVQIIVPWWKSKTARSIWLPYVIVGFQKTGQITEIARDHCHPLGYLDTEKESIIHDIKLLSSWYSLDISLALASPERFSRI